MPDPRSIIKWLQYVPMAYELVKSVMPSNGQAGRAERAEETRQALTEFQHGISHRLDDLEEENARLRERLRDVESMVMNFQLWLWIGGGVLVALVLILLITVIIQLTRG